MQTLKKPKVSWFIKDRAIVDESFIGNFETSAQFKAEVTLVNNYLGLEPIESIQNGILIVSFENYEDNMLLNHLKISFDGVNRSSLQVVGNRGTIKLPKQIAGDYQNDKEGCTLTISFYINDLLQVKTDLKGMYLSIAQN